MDEFDITNELIEDLRRFNSCDHEWVPDPDVDQRISSDEVCLKCGGARMLVTENEFKQFERVLREGRVLKDD